MTWPTVKLGELLNDAILFTDGDWVESKDQDADGDIRLIQLADIGDGVYINKSARFMNSATFSRLRCTEIVRGDILLARMPDPLGRCCIFPGDEKKSVTVVDVCIIRPNANKVNTKWLSHVLNSPLIRGQISGFARGATRVRISRKDLSKLTLPLPPLAEQQRIAAILDKAEEIRRKRELAIAKLDQLAQSTFVEMFGDPIVNTKGFPTKTVQDICHLVRGSSPRPQGDPKYFGGPIPRLMVADLTRDGWLVTPKIDSLTEEGASKSRPVKAGTVVMAVSGNIGLVSRLAVDACIHDGFVGFTKLNESICSPMYLLALLHLSKTAHDKNKAGAIFINLKTDDIKAMLLPIPQLELQDEFEQRLIKIDRQKKIINQSADILNRFNLSLQHQAFTTGFRA